MKKILLLIVLLSQSGYAQLPGGRTAVIDPDLYHDTTGTINLHHKKIWDPGTISYWHADTIIAGFHPKSSTNRQPSDTGDHDKIPDAFYTDDSCFSDEWHGNAFHQIDDGFVVLGGDDSTLGGTHFHPDADARDNGAVIFRANGRIILGSGFRVLNNPDPNSPANYIPRGRFGRLIGNNGHDCSYFHAYVGDRFSDDTSLCGEKRILLDFTGVVDTSLFPFAKLHPKTGDCSCHPPQDQPWTYDNDYVDTAYTDPIDGKVLRLFSQRRVHQCDSIGGYHEDFITGGIQTTTWLDNISCTPDVPGTNVFNNYRHLYGKFEVMAKLPKGAGAWPAIWSQDSKGGNFLNPGDTTVNKNYNYGEIDIVDDPGLADYENFEPYYDVFWRKWKRSSCSPNPSDNPNDSAYGDVSTWVPNKAYFIAPKPIANNVPFAKYQVYRKIFISYKNPAVNHCGISENSFSDCYNKFAYEWLPGEVRFLINDKEVARTTRYVPSILMPLIITNQIAKTHKPGDDTDYFNLLPDSPAVATEMLIKSISADQYDLDSGISCKKADPRKIQSISNPNFTLTLLPIKPNPASGMTQIGYTISGTSDPVDISIALYDVLGKQIMMLQQNSTESPGKHSVNFDSKTLPEGSYYLRVSAGKQIQTARLVVLH